MTRGCSIVVAGLVLALLIAMPVKQALAEDAVIGTAQPSSACPQLFGAEQDRDENQKHLKDLQIRAWEGQHCITLVHSGALKKPVLVHYPGLELVATTTDENGFGVALFRLEDEVDAIDCAPGLYAVESGDCLGDATQVLLVLTDVVLVEHNEKLFYLVSREGEFGPGRQPVFRMVWDSPWSMPRTQPAGGSSRGTTRHSGRSNTHHRKRRTRSKTGRRRIR